MLERAPTLQMEVAKLRPILWLGLCDTRRLRLHLRSAPEPSSQVCPDLPRRRSRSTRAGALHHSRRCSMHSLKTFSEIDRKSTRLNSSHVATSYAVFCLKKKNG